MYMNKFDTLALLFVVSVCALPLLKLTDKDIGTPHYGTLTVFLTPCLSVSSPASSNG